LFKFLKRLFDNKKCALSDVRCAHDRHEFAVGGTGRLGIGLYVLFIEKWLEHFSPDQFLVVRLEDYEQDPRAYMTTLFNFLGLDEPQEWSKILRHVHLNQHKAPREPLYEDTETILRAFYKPYNELLSQLLDNKKFLWDAADSNEGLGMPVSLRQALINENKRRSEESVEQTDSIHEIASRRREPEEVNDPQGFDSENFKSKSFSLEGLKVSATELSDEQKQSLHQAVVDSATALCEAIYTMNFASLKFLLYDVGVPADAELPRDRMRSAFHCLAMVAAIGDANPTSHVFAALKGKSSWVTPHLNPPLELKIQSVLSRDIVDSLSEEVIAVANWLLRAGAPIDAMDSVGWTPLHFACTGGLVSLIKLLLENGANPNAQNREHRTPLHIACAHGDAQVVAMLVAHGADYHLRDVYDVSSWEIVTNPGPIYPDDAMRFLNISQRKAKQINRQVRPEEIDDLEMRRIRTWDSGDGGWSTIRLKDFENDTSCEGIDQYWADEITADELFQNHFAHGSPVLIRGLLNSWDAINNYRRDTIVSLFGNTTVQVCWKNYVISCLLVLLVVYKYKTILAGERHPLCRQIWRASRGRYDPWGIH
jgi:hypothetical protein